MGRTATGDALQRCADALREQRCGDKGDQEGAHGQRERRNNVHRHVHARSLTRTQLPRPMRLAAVRHTLHGGVADDDEALRTRQGARHVHAVPVTRHAPVGWDGVWKGAARHRLRMSHGHGQRCDNDHHRRHHQPGAAPHHACGATARRTPCRHVKRRSPQRHQPVAPRG